MGLVYLSQAKRSFGGGTPPSQPARTPAFRWGTGWSLR